MDGECYAPEAIFALKTKRGEWDGTVYVAMLQRVYEGAKHAYTKGGKMYKGIYKKVHRQLASKAVFLYDDGLVYDVS